MTSPGGVSSEEKPAWRDLARNVGRTLQLSWSIAPGIFVLRLVAAVLRGLLPLAQAYIAGALINGLVAIVSGGGNAQVVYGYVVLGAAALLLERAVWEVGTYIDDLFDVRIDQELERRIFTQILRLDQSYYEDSGFTTLVNKVRENVYALRTFASQLTNLFSSAIGVIGSAIILAAFNPILLIIVGLVVVPFTWVELRQNKRMSAYWDEASDRWRLRNFFRWTLFGSLTQLKEIKLYRAEDRFIHRFIYLNSLLESERLGIRRRGQVGRFLVQIAGVATDLGIQAWLIARVIATNGLFGVGDFQLYRGVIQNFGGEMNSLAFNMSRIQESFIYINDYYKLMAFEPRLPKPRKGIKFDRKTIPHLVFDHVSFRYPKTRKSVLEDISFEMKPGEHIAIVGSNGAGKTTLLKLLLRLYDPQSGSVLLNGRSLQDVDMGSWYDQLGFLFQDFNKYFPLSVRDNVTLGVQMNTSADRRLDRALQQSDAASFVRRLTAGSDQILDPSYKGGTELSGGQWQRLALARSFYKTPNILILDEPTSAIDAAAEHTIFNRLFTAQQGKSMIIISHRFSTVRRADRIIVLDQGRIVEQGTHGELMKLRGKYHELFELQAEGYKAD